ncbi:GNAT family N-acetyltransferase [Paenibacillus sp. CC-CFT747]|nr:GNAT family N-acetyltransferase [Paenibacillus sp. CC-CFT747]
MSRPDMFRKIERMAARTWPPEKEVELGAWRLRASRGVTKRANSVLTAGDYPEGDWLAAAEAFYREQGLPSQFQVSSGSPEELDAHLEQLGYEKIVPCWVMTARTETINRNLGRSTAGFETDIQIDMTEEWLDRFLEMEEFPVSRRPVYERMFRSIQPTKGFLRVLLEGQTVGMAAAVAEDGWAGWINVVTDQRYRRMGIGTEIARALTQWSLAQGAEHTYLQVIEDNEPAVRLYRKAGFERLYDYHYRVKSE